MRRSGRRAVIHLELLRVDLKNAASPKGEVVRRANGPFPLSGFSWSLTVLRYVLYNCYAKLSYVNVVSCPPLSDGVHFPCVAACSAVLFFKVTSRFPYHVVFFAVRRKQKRKTGH